MYRSCTAYLIRTVGVVFPDSCREIVVGFGYRYKQEISNFSRTDVSLGPHPNPLLHVSKLEQESQIKHLSKLGHEVKTLMIA